jgi:hypothetical protein
MLAGLNERADHYRGYLAPMFHGYYRALCTESIAFPEATFGKCRPARISSGFADRGTFYISAPSLRSSAERKTYR